MTEQQVIEQLSRYRQMQARIQVLSTYSVGAGITISRLNQDDQLQELHRRLRGLPSYMYLGKREQRLESAAHAYLTRYPTGIRSQMHVIPRSGADAEDDKLLRELRDKIAKVVAARGWDIRDDIDAILDRVAELQDLQAEVDRIDTVLKALEGYRPNYAKVLRLRYIEGEAPVKAAIGLGITERTFNRWRKRAEEEYKKLSGQSPKLVRMQFTF